MPRCQPASLQRLPSPIIPTSAPRCCPNQSPEDRSEGRPVGSSIPTTFKVSESLTASPEDCHQPLGRGTTGNENPGAVVSQQPIY